MRNRQARTKKPLPNQVTPAPSIFVYDYAEVELRVAAVFNALILTGKAPEFARDVPNTGRRPAKLSIFP